MKPFNIYGVIFVILLWIVAQPLMAQSSQINYSPDGKSGSFTLLSSDCENPGWSYYFEINIPVNVPVKITYAYNENVTAFMYVDNDNQKMICGLDPYSGFTTYVSTTGKLNVFLMDAFLGSMPSFSISFLAGNYADTEDSYIHGNSIVDGSLGVGTISPMAKLDVRGSARIMGDRDYCGLLVDNNFQSSNGAVGITAVVRNKIGPAVGISSFFYGKVAKGESYSALFDGADVAIRTADLIVSNGKIGVNTYFPTQALNVVGKVSIAPSGIDPEENYNGALMITKPLSSGQYLNLVRKDQYPWSIGTVYNTSDFAIGTGSVSDTEFTHPYFVINTEGRVGIGTTEPDQALTVKGKIHANEIIIDLNSPIADYVFNPDYKLMSLSDVEQFVKINNHLPEMPSASEIEKRGFNMGEMQNRLLQKIEELTLYVIQQEKSKKELEKKYSILLEKLEALAR